MPDDRAARPLTSTIIMMSLAAGFLAVDRTGGQGPVQQQPRPYAALVPAAEIQLPGEVDSNSPALWSLDTGQRRLHIATSFAGQPSIATGVGLTRMSEESPAEFLRHPGHGVWMEAIVADTNGTWYGYYHHEVPAEFCGRPDRMIPKIGAARSKDYGRTWKDLGTILEAPPGREVCDTPNTYFVGGVGDLSVMLDPASKELYLFFSQYSRAAAEQGIAVGRLPWARRDRPAGQVDVWVDGAWLPATPAMEGTNGRRRLTWRYPAGTPLVTPRRPWHDADPVTDAFWGASVHWNTFLEQYVMLLNRTKDEAFGQAGIYVSFAPALDDPNLWSAPERLLSGGAWYPQVMGLEPGVGTDKLAGARARFFMSGRSNHVIAFGYR